jgi:hypothetical protein
VVVITGAFMLGCEDEDFSTGTSDLDYLYSQFVHFDSTEYRLVKRDYPRAIDKIPEPLVNWEQSLGEPFTDMNGNEIYEPGIDSFVISGDPNINQDLNGNGSYDSPDDPWSEGVPYDDIDGNGEFRPDPGDHISGYEPGLPYADYNTNNKHDGDLKAAYGVAEWQTFSWFGEGIRYRLIFYDPAVYRFVSDSGLNYDLPFSNAPIINTLITSDTALLYQIDYLSTVSLLRPGIIEAEDSTEIELPGNPNPIFYYRWVTLGESLQVDGLSFSDLVKVRIGNNAYRFDFYFSRGLGIMAYEYWKNSGSGNWENYERLTEYYHKRFNGSHSLIFPTTR